MFLLLLFLCLITGQLLTWSMVLLRPPFPYTQVASLVQGQDGETGQDRVGSTRKGKAQSRALVSMQVSIASLK